MGSDVVQAAWIRADSVILCEMIRREKKNYALGGRAKQLSSPSQGGSYREVRALRRLPSKRYDDSQHLRECRYRYLIA